MYNKSGEAKIPIEEILFNLWKLVTFELSSLRGENMRFEVFPSSLRDKMLELRTKVLIDDDMG